MSEIVAIVPSRGRPSRLKQMVEAGRELSNDEVEFVVGIDSDEPYWNNYANLANDAKLINLYIGQRRSLSAWTNYLASEVLLRQNPPKYLISMGDDHLPKTTNWHRKLKEAIEMFKVPGFAYGDDEIHGSGLCTSWMVSSEIVKTLGWMMLPSLEHMYVDNAIMELGNNTARIVYCPNVVIEHLHPIAHKVAWDDLYNSYNNNEQYAKDLKQFRQWRYSTMFEQDVARILRTV